MMCSQGNRGIHILDSVEALVWTEVVKLQTLVHHVNRKVSLSVKSYPLKKRTVVLHKATNSTCLRKLQHSIL